MEQLTVSEATQLAAAEDVIQQGMETFIDVGNALADIRDSKLYRAKYPTFEEYCQRRWGMKKAQSYRLMDAAQVVNNLSPMGDILPANERQARALSKLTPEEQREAWPAIVETAPNGKITAAHVEKVVKQIQPPDPALAHFRSLRSLVEAADSPAEAATALEMREREQLWAQACDVFNRIGAGESVQGLKELLVLLEDFEMDRPPVQEEEDGY